MDKRLYLQLLIAVYGRILINIVIRMIYLFLPAFSRALNVPVETLASVVSLRAALTVTAPLFGGLSGRFGSEKIMVGALLGYAIALLSVPLFPGFYSFSLALILAGILKNIYDPAGFEFLSVRTPYERRGWVIGSFELAWSLSFFLGMPLVSWLLGLNFTLAWTLPFAVIGSLAAISAALVWYFLQIQKAERHQVTKQKFQLHVRKILATPQVIRLFICGGFITMAQENLLVVLGLWLENNFGFTLAALGIASFIIGAAEMVGEGIVIQLSDRIGKKRTSLIGLFLAVLVYFLLPIISTNTITTMIGLVLFFLAFELAYVSLLPLISEQLPAQRAQVMSFYIAFQWLGRSIGALSGVYLFQFGFPVNSIGGAGMFLAAAIILLFFVKEIKLEK